MGAGFNPLRFWAYVYFKCLEAWGDFTGGADHNAWVRSACGGETNMTVRRQAC